MFCVLGSEKDIMSNVFDGYAVTERPVVNKTTVILVKVRLSINQIMDLVSTWPIQRAIRSNTYVYKQAKLFALLYDSSHVVSHLCLYLQSPYSYQKFLVDEQAA